jgi:hypothetical protein
MTKTGACTSAQGSSYAMLYQLLSPSFAPFDPQPEGEQAIEAPLERLECEREVLVLFALCTPHLHYLLDTEMWSCFKAVVGKMCLHRCSMWGMAGTKVSDPEQIDVWSGTAIPDALLSSALSRFPLMVRLRYPF